MKRWRWSAALIASLLPGFALAQSPEFRGLWSSRFEWPNANPATCKATIDQIMTNAQSSHFNAVLFQVRGQADVLYPSPYEVWSQLIGGVDPGWDPLAYAINAAHTRGLEFHAYINTHTCFQDTSHVLPTNPNHVFYQHCNAADANAREWLICGSSGAPVQWEENDYVWIAPGVPSFSAYIRKQVLYVVNNYAVDGVHFDRIRTPSNLYSYDPISLQRFGSAQTNPGSLGFDAWTADQTTRIVRDIYAAIALANHANVKVSAAVFSNPSTAPVNQHQAALAWAQAGAMDMLVPMMYYTGGAGSTWDTTLQAWLAGSAGRHVVAGQITTEGNAALLDQIALTRTRGAAGNAVFSWGSFTGWSNYLSGPYATVATTPAMSWKTSPTTGIVCGALTDALGAPVVDAQLRLSGQSYVALSSGDGFFSFLLVPPGTYTLSVTHPVYGALSLPGIVVAAGQVANPAPTYGAPPACQITPVTPNPAHITVGSEYTRQMTLAQGVAYDWRVLAGPTGAGIGEGGWLSGWTPTAAQAGQTLTFQVQALSAGGNATTAWSVIVDAVAPCTRFKLTDFESYAAGASVLFDLPRFSGSTSNHLATTPNIAQVTDATTAFSGTKCEQVQWQFVDATAQRWLRLTTNNAANLPNPTVDLTRPIRIRMRLDAGRLRVAVGIRETGTTADIGANGGTSGTIEWLGVASLSSGAPQGRLVEPQAGVWQTLIFNPLTDPITGQTGDGVLSAANGKGVLEQIAFACVDSAGPFTVYIDDIDFLCGLPVFGDLNGDGDVNFADYLILAGCLSGPDVVPAQGCSSSNLEGDGDVDVLDFAILQAACGQAN